MVTGTCAAPGCDKPARKRYCSDRCGQRVRSAAYMRRKRAADPEYVAREREYMRGYLPAYKRERYANDPDFRAAVQREARPRASYRKALKRSAAEPVTNDDLDEILDRHDYRCYVCAAPAEEWDHIIPITKGGPHTVENLAPICRDCNRGVGGKFDKPLGDWLPGRLEYLALITRREALP